MEAATDTKQCPWCAETIKAAAVVCRFCGRDVATGAAPGPEQGRDAAEARGKAINYLAGHGWQLASEDRDGLHFRKGRKWSAPGLMLLVLLPLCGGLLWFPLWGLAVLGLGVVVVHYAAQNAGAFYLTWDKLLAGDYQVKAGQDDKATFVMVAVVMGVMALIIMWAFRP